jgi:hypothetical protein
LGLAKGVTIGLSSLAAATCRGAATTPDSLMPEAETFHGPFRSSFSVFRLPSPDAALLCSSTQPSKQSRVLSYVSHYRVFQHRQAGSFNLRPLPRVPTPIIPLAKHRAPSWAPCRSERADRTPIANAVLASRSMSPVRCYLHGRKGASQTTNHHASYRNPDPSC